MINDAFLVAGVCQAEYSWIGEQVVQKIGSPSNPTSRLRKELLL